VMEAGEQKLDITQDFVDIVTRTASVTKSRPS
jgi:hypothetical protein